MKAREAVQVTAADYNGSSWDGCPFSSVPGWLAEAIETFRVKVKPDDRDYALWQVGDDIAEPGDWIERRENGSLAVVRAAR